MRIKSLFKQLKAENKTALIPYITAGDPNLTASLAIMHSLVEQGADLIELGIPFSDPMADGPVIQLAHERALKQHVGLSDVLALVKQFRQTNTDTPIVLMGYLNPIETMGYQVFAEQAAQAGVDGVLTVDLPPEEATALTNDLLAQHLEPIYLITPTTSPERIEKITYLAHGYIYYVSLKGVTGSQAFNAEHLQADLQRIRAHTSLPLCVGFGIRDAATAQATAQHADGVIVGSALVSLIAEHGDNTEVVVQQCGAFMSKLRTAVDAG